MTSDGVLIVQFIFQTIWKFFTGWYIPGTGTTPAAFFLFVGSAGIGLKIILRVLSRNSTAGSGFTKNLSKIESSSEKSNKGGLKS